MKFSPAHEPPATPTRATRRSRGCHLAVLVWCCLLALPITAQGLSFSDQTTLAGVPNIYTPGFFAHSVYSGGAAAGDFNRDGWQDLFVPSDAVNGEPDRLFINDGDGTFTDQAASWGLTVPHMGKGAAVGDFNNDGWLDIYCTSAGPFNSQMPGHHKLYRNNGNSSFTNIAVTAGVAYTTATSQDGFGACWGDYDLDGDLDLFVAGTAANNLGSVLFRNEGNEIFSNQTMAAGLFVGLGFTLHCFAPRMVDMDGDRYPELLLVADFGTSRYYKNNGNGTFTDASASSNTAQEENGMGQTVGDFDNDGDIDWYVTSIFQAPTGWTGNKLYLNLGSHVYQETAVNAGVFDGGYGWGAVAADFDHDGDTDIAETNGGLGQFANQPSYLWLNNGNGTFSEQAASTGFVHTGEGRGLLGFDHDNDGDQDLVLSGYFESMVLFRNDLAGPDTSWLRVFLTNGGAATVAPDGYGAKVRVAIGTVTRVRSIDGGDNFLSKNELSAHFGLGAATLVDELVVEWPDGELTVMTDVAVNQTLTITYPALPFLRGDANVDGAVDIADAIAILGQLFGGTVSVQCSAAADVNHDDATDVADPIYLLAYSFTMGPPPPAPFPACDNGPPHGLPCAVGCQMAP